jgi:predicted RNase H-like HicB family nuclease
VQIHIEELPESVFLATSDELPGLVAQGRTVAEALEIARDIVRKLIEARREREGIPNSPSTRERLVGFRYSGDRRGRLLSSVIYGNADCSATGGSRCSRHQR